MRRDAAPALPSRVQLHKKSSSVAQEVVDVFPFIQIPADTRASVRLVVVEDHGVTGFAFVGVRAMLMRILWRMRSPFSGDVTACLLVESPPSACELLIVPVANDQRPCSSLYPDTEAATRSATVLATTLRAEGWTDTKDVPPSP